ncbi:hypothetical protein PFMG_01347 [Plasmodium falciparum IGH-CR14]|uniref:Asparagine-rich antigen n=1 Tax=Plasmodium falciparum IGH-CR14 TaxID=580059 RepID=A0A0L1I6S5_PLAFA|nr:hypothetical protein PFMG_01347 [Plasmodium falciparum IGH-CR14]
MYNQNSQIKLQQNYKEERNQQMNKNNNIKERTLPMKKEEKKMPPLSHMFDSIVKIKKQVDSMKSRKEENNPKGFKKDNRKRRKPKYRFEKDKDGNICDFFMVCSSELKGIKKCRNVGLDLQMITVTDIQLTYHFVCKEHDTCEGSVIVIVDIISNNNIEIKGKGPLCINFNDFIDEKKKNTGNRFKWEYLDVCGNIQEGKDRATAMGYKYLNSSVTGKRYVRNFVCILNAQCNSRLRIIKDNETDKVWLELSGMNHEEHCPYSPHSVEGMFLNNKKNKNQIISSLGNDKFFTNNSNILNGVMLNNPNVMNAPHPFNKMNYNYHNMNPGLNNFNSFNNANYAFINMNYNDMNIGVNNNSDLNNNNTAATSNNNTHNNNNNNNSNYNPYFMNNYMNSKNHPLYLNSNNNYGNDIKMKILPPYMHHFNKAMKIIPEGSSCNVMNMSNGNNNMNQMSHMNDMNNMNNMNNTNSICNINNNSR